MTFDNQQLLELSNDCLLGKLRTNETISHILDHEDPKGKEARITSLALRKITRRSKFYAVSYCGPRPHRSNG